MMQINVDKTSYMIFSRSQTEFKTRLTVDNAKLDQVHEAKIVGVWLTPDMKWEKNTKELTRKAYSRMSMLTKLKYAGVGTEDLLDVYILFIRSVVEYCTVVWHSSITIELIKRIEMVQKTCLRVILGDSYISYGAALEMCNLDTLFDRREARCLTFAKKCLKHPVHRRMFPLNSNNGDSKHRSRENYTVNFARTNTYQKSAVPYLQRMLNAL